ncbi:hypothetical protein H0H93_001012 [Arthromyces matolae]|nr:hypothetical protein H0H93_001012 [Arthromyces matolae]
MHKRAALACKPSLGARSLDQKTQIRFKNTYIPRSPYPSTKKQRLDVPKPQYDSFANTALKVIQHAAHTPEHWAGTRTLRGKEMELAAMLKSKGSKERKSMEQEEFEKPDESDEDDSIHEVDDTSLSLPPGTFIETRRNMILSHGVVLGTCTIERRKKLLTLIHTGDIFYPGRQDVLFSLPNFVPMDLVERCQIDSQTPTPVARNARIEILRRIRDVEYTVERAQNFVSQKSAAIYEKIRSPDPDAWVTTTLHEVAPLISPDADNMTLFGLHKYIMSHSSFFIPSQTYETDQLIYVRPKSHVDNIALIRDWTRTSNGPIEAFAAKVNHIIPIYQQTHEESRNELPSYTRAPYAWTDSDLAIVKFLQHAIRQSRANQKDPYALGVSHIMKAITPERTVASGDVYQLLVNIGALAPWQDPISLDPSLGVNLEPEPTSSWIQSQESIASRSFASMRPSAGQTPLGPEDFHRTDPLESVRHDFGDLPVFVIDDPHAEELDDGLSIERIPSDPDHLWLHVHIADPASLIPPTHVLAKEAAIRTTTIYHTHRTWPLFPKSVMSHPTYGLSLGRKVDKSPMKVLTFSAKVDKLGAISEYNVRAGILRNIHVVTYEQVNAALGEPETSFWYPFGRQTRSESRVAELSDAQVQDLRAIQTVANRLVSKRYRDGVIISARNRAELTPLVRPPPEVFGHQIEPKTFRGFPTFAYAVGTAADADSGSRLLVGEAMKVASRVASRFCLDNNLPIMRRVADSSSLGISGDRQELLDMRSPNCYIPRHLVLNRLESLPASGYSMEPKAHYTLGVPEGEGYTRCTSPLRRYIDLVAHWQIHHALLGSKAPRSSPPFSADEVWEITKFASGREGTAVVIDRVHNKFWQTLFIKRWAEDSNMDDPENVLNNLKAFVLNRVSLDIITGRLQCQVEIPYLGVQGILVNLPTVDSVAFSSQVDVKIDQIIIGERPQILFALKNDK